MSRIGRLPVAIPSGVDITIDGQTVTVKGPKGELQTTVTEPITVARTEDGVEVTRPDDERESRSLHGLFRSLINNMVVGVTDGYEKKVRQINDELNELRRKRIEDADKIKRQAIISDQLQHESSRSTRTEAKLTNMMEVYKKEHRKEMEGLIQEAERLRRALPEKEREAQKLVDSLKETRDKMRWVMTQHERQNGGK